MKKRVIDSFTAVDEHGEKYTIQTVQPMKLERYIGGETELVEASPAHHEWNGHQAYKLGDGTFDIKAINKTVRRTDSDS